MANLPPKGHFSGLVGVIGPYGPLFLDEKGPLFIVQDKVALKLKEVDRPYVTSHFFRPVTLFLSKCNNSSWTDAIEMKLHMWTELKRVKSHAQDS